MARETWTDERLGDLAAKVDKGFAEAKVEVRDLRSDMDKGFAEVKGEIRDLRSEFSAMQRTMIIGFATVAASTVASVIAAALVV
jgi:ribosome recycling factor